MSTKFAWKAVSAPTSRALLQAAYGGRPDPELPLNVHGWSPEQLAAQLHAVYGSPPQRKKLDHHPRAWEVLRDRWAVKEANKGQLATLVSYAMASLPVKERLDADSTMANLRAFAGKRNFTGAFKTNLRAAFIGAHKIATATSSGHSTTKSVLSKPRALEGRGAAPNHHPYPHQLDAGKALNKLISGGKVGERRGLIVLPTGAGKTSTVVDWLLPRMASDPALRVLWLAHQHELLTQAARAFEEAAAQQKPGFSRKLRVISSKGSATSTLVEADLSVALVTWQSLSHSWAQQQTRLKQFLSRPAVVVVDEAHHAAARAYQDILTEVRRHPGVVLVGLTATPWPTKAGAGLLLRKTFPVDILTRTPEEMHLQGILATPVFHTVDTGQHLRLTKPELAKSKGDLSPSVLKRLVNDARDDLLVRTWTGRKAQWGKTLVFATSQPHADRLGQKLGAAEVEVKVTHSTSAVPLTDALAWFRKVKHPAVLVSVGMLTEGVDLPDARTAFLARPTTSRILMRQMMGRVLRGEKAGGEATGHIVYFRDQWLNFDDVIEPGELPGFNGSVAIPATSGHEHRLPPVLDSSGGQIGEDVLAQVRRMYSTRIASLPLDPVTTATTLVGYYALDDMHVPVMDHQRDTYDELIKRALAGKGFAGFPALSMFNSDPPPYPTERTVRAVLNYIKTYQSAPTLVPIRAHVSSLEIARRLREDPAMTEAERGDWLRGQFESSLARLAYESFAHFEEAVDRDLRELRHLQQRRLDPERVAPRHPSPELPKLIRATSRALPSVSSVSLVMMEHLAGEAVLERLDLRDLPVVSWTARVGSRTWPAAWAYWSMKNTGKLKGQGVIRVHRALRAPHSQVSDSLLQYLIFHEMLHHLLPGQGHSAEFRRLEHLWPDADHLDFVLDTLHEHYRLPTSTE